MLQNFPINVNNIKISAPYWLTSMSKLSCSLGIGGVISLSLKVPVPKSFCVKKINIFLKSVGLRPDSNLAKFPDQVPNSDPQDPSTS
jgi:hypothetical protein